jgi:D-arabinose 1-dehydrogenase-like Zn-dependent alcohol dehydrogenase
MKIMSLRAPGEALQPDEAPLPVIEPGQVLLEVQACGVCRTDLHLQDGELPNIPSFPYRLLWEERSIVSVANLTRQDGEDFMSLAAQIELKPEVETMPLARANDALDRLRRGEVRGAAVLVTKPQRRP